MKFVSTQKHNIRQNCKNKNLFNIITKCLQNRFIVLVFIFKLLLIQYSFNEINPIQE